MADDDAASDAELLAELGYAADNYEMHPSFYSFALGTKERIAPSDRRPREPAGGRRRRRHIALGRPAR